MYGRRPDQLLLVKKGCSQELVYDSFRLISEGVCDDDMSRKIAFAGIFAGISVVLLYVSALMPTGKITLYFLASLPVAFTIIEAGAGAGIISYIVICILSGLITGSINGMVPFALFFGHYPIFKYFIEKKRKALSELLLKLFVFNISIVLWYLLFKSIFMVTLPGNGDSILITALIIALQAVFFIYDYVFSRVLHYYMIRLDSFRQR